jgi:hypothetical protein
MNQWIASLIIVVLATQKMHWQAKNPFDSQGLTFAMNWELKAVQNDADARASDVSGQNSAPEVNTSSFFNCSAHPDSVAPVRNILGTSSSSNMKSQNIICAQEEEEFFNHIWFS